MGERENLRNVANKLRQLLERREGAGEHKYREQEENGKLDGLRLCSRKRRDEQPETKRAKQEKKTNNGKRSRLIEPDVKMPRGQGKDHDDQEDGNREVRQDLAAHNLAAPQRRNQQFGEGGRLTLPRDRAGYECDREQLQNQSDNARYHVVYESRFRIVENPGFGRPRFHERNELFTNLHGQLLAELYDFVGQRVDHHVALLHLKIG